MLKALADPARLRLLSLVAASSTGEACACDLVEPIGRSQPTVSHHLAILREAGLVDVRHEGKQAYYTLNQERMAVCCGQLMQVFAPESEVTEAVKTACEC